MIKTLIIGAGRVAQHYSEIFRKYNEELANFKVCTIVDTNEERAEKLALEFGADTSSNLENSLANFSYDLVVVLSPSYLHFMHARDALLSNCNVLVEKPSTLLIDNSFKLGQIAKERNLKLGTVVQNRFNKSTEFAKRAIDSGWIGKVQSVAVRLIWSRDKKYYEDEWHGRWSTDGGVLSQQGFHHLDIARFLCGEVLNVFSKGAHLRHEIEVDDTSVGVLEFRSGALGTIELTTAAPREDLEASIKIIGSEGHVEIGGIALNAINSFYSEHLDLDLISQYRLSCSENFKNGYGISHYRVLRSFGDSITNEKSDYFSWDDTTKTLELIHALYASQETSQLISLGDGFSSMRLGVSKFEY